MALGGSTIRFQRIYLIKKNFNNGVSILEALIAGALLIISATFMMPVFFSTAKTYKGTDFRDLCTKAVKQKIAQYQSGFQVTGTTASAGQLGALQSASIDGTLQGASASNGWLFAKYIYNLRTPRYSGAGLECIPDTERSALPPTLPPSTPANLGVEEAIGSPTAITGNGISVNCASNICGSIQSACPCPEDSYFSRQLGNGFRIYTHLQRVHSLTNSIVHPNVLGDCPHEGTGRWGAANAAWAKEYDFDGATDAIKITVTAMLDLNSAVTGARTNFAGISQNSPTSSTLVCSESAIIKPPTKPFRYILGRYIPPINATADSLSWPRESTCGSGGTYEGRCEGAIMDMYGRPVFRALWSPNIRAFNVAPNNRAVYVLYQTGELYRYGDETVPQTLGTTCVGAPAECTSDGSGDPDKLLTGTLIATMPGMKAFGIVYTNEYPDAGEHDNFQFTPIRFYGLIEDSSTLRLVYTSIATPGANITSDIGTNTSLIPTGLNTFPRPPLTIQNSFDSWFLSPLGSQAYVLVRSCLGSAPSNVENSYCNGIYRFEDSSNLDAAESLERIKYNIFTVSP